MPGGTGSCGNRTNRAIEARNALITIERIVQDPQLKAEYKEVRAELDEMIKDSITVCPDTGDLNILLDYIRNEYAKYN